MNFRSYSLAFALLLAGCSGTPENDATAQSLIDEVAPEAADQSAPQNEFGFAEALEGPNLFGENVPTARSSVVGVGSDGAQPAGIKQQAAVNQIAYSYGFGFRIDGDKIPELQKAHMATCQKMAEKCRILRVSEASGDWDAYGEIKLEVAASEAGDLAKSLAEPADKLGGELISSVRDGEDLSESIIDSEARLASRLALRNKLTSILQKSTGSVDELIKAERAIAEINEEIDATRTKLESYRNRIRFSNVNIEYQPEFGQSQLGFGRPVMTALRSVGTTLGTTTAVLIYAVTALIPITLFILALRWVLHRFGLRIRFWRKNPTETGKLASS